LATPIYHALEAFISVSGGQPLLHHEHYKRKTRKECNESAAIRPRSIDPDSIIVKEDPTRPLTLALNSTPYWSFYVTQALARSPEILKRAKPFGIMFIKHLISNMAECFPMGVHVSYISNRFSLLDLEREEFPTNFL